MNNEDYSVGAKSYAIYCKSVDYKTWDNRDTPVWDELTEKIQTAWVAVGRDARSTSALLDWRERLSNDRVRAAVADAEHYSLNPYGAPGHMHLTTIHELIVLLDLFASDSPFDHLTDIGQGRLRVVKDKPA